MQEMVFETCGLYREHIFALPKFFRLELLLIRLELFEALNQVLVASLMFSQVTYIRYLNTRAGNG